MDHPGRTQLPHEHRHRGPHVPDPRPRQPVHRRLRRRLRRRRPARPEEPAPSPESENAHCERFIGTLRRELLDRTLILNEWHLRRTLTSYLEHYKEQRPHRALRQLCPSQAEAGPPRPIDIAEHRVYRRAVLGGLINEYQISS
ncbi:integrase core domain-containing protein [Streptomyces sp. NPDC005131]